MVNEGFIQRYSKVLRIILGISIIIFLLYKIDISKVLSVLSNTSFIYLGAVIALSYSTIWIGAYNLYLLLRPLTRNIPFSRVLRYSSISWGAGLFVPGKLGEFSIIYFLQKEKVPLGYGTLMAIFNKLITIIALTAISIVGVYVYLPLDTARNLTIIMISGIIILIISETSREFIKKYILRNHAPLFKGFSKFLRYFLTKRKRLLVLTTIITLFKWIIMALMPYLLFHSFGYDAEFVHVLLITAVTAIISLIPLSISGLGVKEATAVFLFNQIGTPSEITISVFLILLAVQYVMGTIFVLGQSYER
jgi:uncharacterized protein (TIRG00374 family)